MDRYSVMNHKDYTPEELDEILAKLGLTSAQIMQLSLVELAPMVAEMRTGEPARPFLHTSEDTMLAQELMFHADKLERQAWMDAGSPTPPGHDRPDDGQTKPWWETMPPTYWRQDWRSW